MMLFKGAGPQFQVAWQVMIPTVAPSAVFSLPWLPWWSGPTRIRPYTGSEGLIGQIGVVKSIGRQARARCWFTARCGRPGSRSLRVGAKVEVDGGGKPLTVIVKPAADS
jgi:hypothetical protein